MLLHTFVVLQLLLHEAELFLGPLQVLLQSGDLCSVNSCSQQRCLLIHNRHFMLDSYKNYFDPLFGFSFRTLNRASGATVYKVIFFYNYITYLKAC